MTLDRFFDEKICRPLGMNDTSFKVSKDKRSRLVAAYVPVDDGIKKLEDGEIGPNQITADYPYAKSHKYLSGGGGLCSTPSDYMRFCQMLLNGGELDGRRLLRKETVEMMTANQIAQRQAIPPKYLPQIVSELSQAGLLHSVRGYGGGIRLARRPNELTLMDIIKAIQGQPKLFECQLGHVDCVHLPNCGLQSVYDRALAALTQVFEQTRLSDIHLSQHERGSDG